MLVPSAIAADISRLVKMLTNCLFKRTLPAQSIRIVLFEVGEVAVYDLTQNLGSRTEARLAGLIADEDASFDAAQSVVYALLTSLQSRSKWNRGRILLLSWAVWVWSQAGTLSFGFLASFPRSVDPLGAHAVPVAVFELSLNGLFHFLMGHGVW